MIMLPLLEQPLRTARHGDVVQVWDPIRQGWFVLTPEEHVRQALLQYLCAGRHYPSARIAVEKKVLRQNLSLRFDAVIYDSGHTPWMIVECKSPDVAVSDDTLHQLLRYQHTLQCRYWLLCNGLSTFCAENTSQGPRWLQDLPAYGS